MVYDWIANGKPSAVGGAIGLVAGLVVVTPAAGFVSVGHAMLMGAVGGIVCNFMSRAMRRATRLDDALDVFACHGVGGIIGALMTGLFASTAVNSGVVKQGLLVGGEPSLFLANLTGTCAVILFSVVGTFVLLKLIGVFMNIRVSEEVELTGLDDALHGEYARYREQGKK
jgi:Amt family ammonium transporter